ncbi:Aldo/keto reductase [Agrocybe pediades]|nr:Aldo/keto reductase [Agrocybe pediades]
MSPATTTKSTPTTEQKSELNVVMGAMTFGEEGKHGARVFDLKDVQAILDVFHSHGHTEIDTARFYAAGTSEEYLGKLNVASQGFKIQTKLYPAKYPALGLNISHDEASIKKHLQDSLKALNVKTLDMWYLHGPDRTVPYEITLKAVNDAYKEGLFKKFGISNYTAWEVAEIVGICNANGYVQPSVYQGIYNAIHRAAEPELFPCLRKFGISFYEFNPLAGGFFTGRYLAMEDAVDSGSRFDPENLQGQQYRARYWKEPYFKALNSVKQVADKHGLTLTEVALRWVSHHSLMKREHGDAILIGASSLNHIEQNLVDLEKGPLPEEVVKALDNAWFELKPYSSPYHH